MTQTLDQSKDISPAALKVGGQAVLKASGEKELFDPDKLRGSLTRAGAPDKVIEDIIAHIEPEIYDGIPTEDIYKHAFTLLHKEARPVARKYSIRRAIMDLGPSGFPFEDFVAQILKARGLETLTRQTVLGACVPHEVDVVAWDESRLIMVEAKFHNTLGTKSDLKVALYIKARFDDLEENLFNYGDKDRRVTDAWLVTNTKFSSTAVHYGACKGLTMIGWNYPAQGNLQDMVEEAGLHPITCLTSLSTAEKMTLLRSGTVLCSQLKSDPEILSRALGSNFNSSAVIEEINEL